MISHTHNMLHVKKKIRPVDYNDDPNCKIVTIGGREVVLPVVLIKAVRAGLLKVVA